MKKFVLAILILILIAFVAFWFIGKPNAIDTVPNQVTIYQGNNKEQLQSQYGKTLIVYYSFTGSARDIALKVQEKTGGDIYPIQPKDNYSATAMIYWTAYDQINNGYLPTLQDVNVNIENYDTILIGSPVWVYNTSPPLASFLAQTDFAGKKVAAFCTQGGNAGIYFEEFKKKIKNANLVENLYLETPSKRTSEEVDRNISTWLDEVQLNP